MEINSKETIKRIFEECRAIAVVGLSSNPFRPSNGFAAYIQKEGFRIIPVNFSMKQKYWARNLLQIFQKFPTRLIW